MIQQIPTEEAMLAFASLLAKAIPHHATIFLDGSLGAGKTTFARGFLRGLGFAGKVKSPTYTLVEPYHLDKHHVFHFDLYRLKTPEELYDIGIEEYFTPNAICLIEWPEKGGSLLPQPDLFCRFSIEGEGRQVQLEARTPLGQNILEALMVN